ncbi:hypothetical protein BMR07_18560 [Methylococcaceae bacterium CS1]|nr:hypothetical protein BMR07_18560 [Methylococcaceae bacterium CS1]
MSYDDSHIDAVLVIAMLYFMSVRTKEASSFHKDFGVYFKSELQLKDNNKLEPPKPPKLKFPNNYLW